MIAGLLILAGCDDSGVPPPEVDQQAVTVLRDAVELAREAETVSFTIEAQTSRVSAGRNDRDSVQVYSIMIQRPNRLSIIPAHGWEGGVLSDGDKLYVWTPAGDEYSVAEAPATMEEIVTTARTVPLVATSGPITHVVRWLISDGGGWGRTLGGVDVWLWPFFHRVEYVGRERLEGPAMEGHRVRLMHRSMEDMGFDEFIDWPIDSAVAAHRAVNDVWIGANDGLIRRIDSNTFSTQGLTVSVRLADWQVNEPLPDDAFTFAPVDDAVRVDPDLQLLRPRAGTMINRAGPSPKRSAPGAPPRTDGDTRLLSAALRGLRGVRGAVAEWCDGRHWPARLILLLGIVYVAVHHLAYHRIDYPYGSVSFTIWQSPTYPLDLTFHELGHAFFMIFGFVGLGGHFLVAQGGTLFQLGLPLVAAGMFVRQRDYFAVCAAGAWLAVNLYYVQWYISDARAEAQPMLKIWDDGVEHIHDWSHMLGRLGLLEYDLAIGAMVRCGAFVLMWGSIVAGAWMVGMMIRSWWRGRNGKQRGPC